MALIISVTFADNQVHYVQLLPEKLNWDNLVTALQLSVPQASNRDSLVFYCRLPKTNEPMMVSNQFELEEIISSLKMPYNHLHFYESLKNAKSVIEISPFEELARLVKHYQPLEYHISCWVGNLAFQMAFSPKLKFDRELLWLEKTLEDNKNKRDRQKRHDDELEEFTFVGSEKKEDTDTSDLESEGEIPNLAKEGIHSPYPHSHPHLHPHPHIPPRVSRSHHHPYPHNSRLRHYHPPPLLHVDRRFSDSHPFACFNPFDVNQFGFGVHLGHEGQFGRYFGDHGSPFEYFDGHVIHPPFSFQQSSKPFCEYNDK